MQKECRCRFTFDPQRTNISFCYEFCGLLNVQMKDLLFYLNGKLLPFQKNMVKPCEIIVFRTDAASQNVKSSNLLKPAFSRMLSSEIYPDIQIALNGEEPIKAHKCVLMARSQKFKTMLSLQLKETETNLIEIKSEEFTLPVLKAMLHWIYSGECEFPESVKELLILLKMTDEYFLQDLQKVCEEEIVERMDGMSALEILTSQTLVLPMESDYNIKEVCKSVLLAEYEKVEALVPDIEVKIAQVKGLMSDLFMYKRQKKSLTVTKRRKNSLIDES